MRLPISAAAVAAAIVATLSACSTPPATTSPEKMTQRDVRHGEILVTEHRGADDLLTAGLGREGLFELTPPKVAIPDAPTHAELRRRAVYANWRGIATL